jgi:MFS family permease
MSIAPSPSPRFAGRQSSGCLRAFLVLLGLVFLAAGLAGLAAALGWIDGPGGLPAWVPGVFGGVAGAIGLAMLVGGLTGGARPPTGTGWLADHAWDQQRAEDESGRGLLVNWMIPLVMCGVLAPVGAAMAATGHTPWPVWAIVGLFALVAVGLLIRAMYLTGRRIKYGRSTLRFDRPPFAPGTALLATLVPGAAIEATGQAKVALSCHEERTVTVRTAKGGHRREVRVSTIRCLEEDLAVERLRPGDDLPLKIALPADLPGTAIRSEVPRYWILSIVVPTSGIDFRAEFLVPIYAAAPAA